MKLTGQLRPALLGAVCATFGATAIAAPMTYNVDSAHTYPTFEADHLGGLSYWRGKINSTSGTVTLDQEAGTGSVSVTMDMSSIDFGHDGLNDHVRSDDMGMFNVAEFPTATYEGQLAGFQDGAPTRVEGTLTFHGVSRPVTLNIEKFLCKPHPFNQRPMCGADATAQIDRSEFGVNFGQGIFDMGVTLRISIEAAMQE
jgi:polyisoprenoid-binding protein YceI